MFAAHSATGAVTFRARVATCYPRGFLGRDLPALRRRAATGFRTAPRRLVLVFLALGGAGVAYAGADQADVPDILQVVRERRGARPAELPAIAARPEAEDHVTPAGAGLGAAFTLPQAFVAGRNAALEPLGHLDVSPPDFGSHDTMTSPFAVTEAARTRSSKAPRPWIFRHCHFFTAK
jgi:hypothetical protein